MAGMDRKEALEQAKKVWTDDEKKAPSNTNDHAVSGKKDEEITLDDTKLPEKSVVHLQNNKNCTFTFSAKKIVKLLVQQCDDCTVIIDGCMLMTGTVEIWACKNVSLKTNKTIGTLQLDMNDLISIEFARTELMGQIVQAGVKKYTVSFACGTVDSFESGVNTIKETVDPELEVTDNTSQYITRFVDGKLLTEKLIRLANDFPSTMRERNKYEVATKADEEKMKELLGLVDANADLSEEDKKKLQEMKEKQEAAKDVKDYGDDVRSESKRKKGNEAYKEGNIPQALVNYTESIEILPTAAALSNRAACFLSLKQNAEALEDAEACLKLEPETKIRVKALFRRGLALVQLEKFEEACQSFGKALELEPNNKSARSSLALAQRKLAKSRSS